MPKNIIQEAFYTMLQSQAGIEQLFEYIPHLLFWVKDTEFKFVIGNQAVAETCGCANESEIIGKTDYDFFHKDLADNFRKDDEYILETGQPIENRIELLPSEDGTVDWYSTFKIPVYSKSNTIIGTAGFTKIMKKADISSHPHADMAKVLNYVSKNYMNHIEISHLATLTGYSLSQFERRFKQTMQLTPEKFINAVRIRMACKKLVNSRESIKHIAYETGFCNQSYFSKQFRNHMKLSPKDYRRKYFNGD
ncbi:MAG: AraC family transcriptional regulator [Fibrobacteria bacterium]|nr:AraC family transcriptional regulator [Fibrobacteria bacterium]